jgi:hypothetical protein
MVHATGRLMQHPDHWKVRATQGEPGAKESGGDTIEYQDLGSQTAGSPEDPRRGDRGQGKGALRKGDEVDPGIVARRHLRHPPVVEIAPREAARVTEGE